MNKVLAAVLGFPGSNGDRDLCEALRLVGFAVTMHPADQPLPQDIALAALPGGFSYGDYWRAGMLASQAKAVLDLAALVARGGLVLGVCNGFQILVEAGLLPGALRSNSPAGFMHRWIEVEVQPTEVASPWFHGLAAGSRLRMPMAHGEGNFFHPQGAEAVRGRTPLTYVGQNPNGSQAHLAALLDTSGQILGIMPHPERAVTPCLGSSDGRKLLTTAHQHLQSRWNT